MTKPVLVSGIQPSGRLHIGNYLGALKHFVELQNSGKYECYFFIADFHSLTEEFSAREKTAQIMELATDYLAAGLDPKKSTLFLQSQVPAHSELAWILNTITPMGELERMTQFKDKSDTQKQNVNAGLLTYPALMAADIIVYDAKFVPVGHDQLQHLELTRTLARKFNSRFGKTFVEPQPLLTETPRVMSLGDPAKKMAKSSPETCLFLDSAPAEIIRKVKSAVTDSGSEVKFDPGAKPAISNLLLIFSGISGETIPSLEHRFHGKTYSEFKNALAETLIEHLATYRKNKTALKGQQKKVRDALIKGSAKAEKVAEKKIKEVKQKLGIAL